MDPRHWRAIAILATLLKARAANPKMHLAQESDFMDMPVLIVGASGVVGAALASLLISEGHSVRRVTGREASAPDEVHVDLVTGEGRAAAFDGIGAAFVFSPTGLADQASVLLPLIEQAKTRDLKKTVLLTALNANADDATPLRQCEIALEQSGLSYNIIRPNWFFQNFNSSWAHDIKAHGRIRLPAASAEVSFIDSRDISSVAARLLTSDDFSNQAFDLTGPAAISFADVAEAMSRALGRKIVYEEISPDEFKANSIASGVPEDFADMLTSFFAYVREGTEGRLSEAVLQVTGQAPADIEKYVNDYKVVWE